MTDCWKLAKRLLNTPYHEWLQSRHAHTMWSMETISIITLLHRIWETESIYIQLKKPGVSAKEVWSARASIRLGYNIMRCNEKLVVIATFKSYQLPFSLHRSTVIYLQHSISCQDGAVWHSLPSPSIEVIFPFQPMTLSCISASHLFLQHWFL